MSLSTPSLLLPPTEQARLSSLRTHNIVSAPSERIFAELVELSAHVFGLPVSLLAIVDAEQVVYKASHGLPALRSQPRAETLCAIVVRENKPVVFTDIAATQHPYLLPTAALAAQAAGVRFYAGAPLRLSDTYSLGTLCVLGYQPRAFSASEQHLLEQLAHVASLTIAARCACLAGEGLGAAHWSIIEDQLAEEVRALVALVRYLLSRPRPELAMPLLVLDHVARRLREVRELLEEYQA
jgi:GAF domain-containing protein